MLVITKVICLHGLALVIMFSHCFRLKIWQPLSMLLAMNWWVDLGFCAIFIGFHDSILTNMALVQFSSMEKTSLLHNL